MNPEQSSISIINKNNGQVTGESAGALPVKFVSNFSTTKIFAAGFISAIVLMMIVVTTIKSQVVVVEVAGKSADYQEYQLK
jgi:hypothetical protein